MPSNEPRLVDALLEELALEATLQLVVKETATTLGEALARNYEVTTATPRFLEHWSGLTSARELQLLLDNDHAAERTAFLREHHIVDIVRRFPMRGIDPQRFVAGLRPLQPRLYSIASSLAAAPDEVHLTVATVRYALHGEGRSGVASGHFADRATQDATLPVYVHANPHFRLPTDEAPIIMIGAGTGVAPYRAFLQEREIRGASGRAWLVFGERNFRSDFLYQTEWQSLLKDGVLTRMDVAFSRDQSARAYVQHRLREQARDIYAWLEDGAHIYVCGDATHMAPDVHAALANIVEQQGGLAPAAAEDYLRGLQRENRYQRDVY
jgi:sulfite reductase (NADPH) flavoprotein alpha-component